MNEQQTILLVDDSEDDLVFMREAFKQAKCTHPLQAVRNGEEAIAYLNGEGPYGDRKKFPLPIVMLLDLNMPKKNGYDVLAWVRAQPVLKRLAIIILTASMRREDVERAFNYGATSFLVKPSNLETLAAMMRCLCDWLQINHFPILNETGENKRQATTDADAIQPHRATRECHVEN
jgi:CheY-like chemotaxis protein